MRIAPDWRRRTGYRLCTTEEWEFVALAGAATDFCFGQDITMIRKYACCLAEETEPGYLLKPNDFGLFATSGNVWEWCHVSSHEDQDDVQEISDLVLRPIAGGTFGDLREAIRNPHRQNHPVTRSMEYIGFRVFRTLDPGMAISGGDPSDQPNK
jgi:formylglycine-generating enzyme required for sulfatase activity